MRSLATSFVVMLAAVHVPALADKPETLNAVYYRLEPSFNYTWTVGGLALQNSNDLYYVQFDAAGQWQMRARYPTGTDVFKNAGTYRIVGNEIHVSWPGGATVGSLSPDRRTLTVNGKEYQVSRAGAR